MDRAGPNPREHARDKDASKYASDGLPLHSLRTLLQALATLAYNITHTSLNPNAKIVITTRPTPLQDKAFSPATEGRPPEQRIKAHWALRLAAGASHPARLFGE